MNPTVEKYREEYRGINIEASRHWREGYGPSGGRKEVWCFYIYLAAEMFPEHLRSQVWLAKKPPNEFGSRFYDYSDTLISNLDWHCGMTWYSKESSEDDEFRAVKAGCDYDHIWDEGGYYSAASVLADARRCVDSLFVTVPELKTMRQLWEEYRKPFEEKRALQAGVSP